MRTQTSVHEAVESLARYAQRVHDVDHTLTMLTQTALETIPGVDFVSISLRQGDGPVETLAPTDELVVRIGDLQHELREGPCYDVAVNGETLLVVNDLEHDERWPRFGPRVVELGVRSQMALTMLAEERRRAALNLYSKQVGTMDQSVEIADLFASHASLVVGFAETVEHLDHAMLSRKVIGQAIGIIMERYGLDEDRAFGFLTRASQARNEKLRIIAEQIVTEANRRRGRARPDIASPPLQNSSAD